jgi:hypothetical protein
MSDYEAEEFKKLQLVVQAALCHGCTDDTIEIKTRGFNPHASVTIKAYVLQKFLRAPESGIDRIEQLMKKSS